MSIRRGGYGQPLHAHGYGADDADGSPTAAHTKTVKTTPPASDVPRRRARLSAPRRGCSGARPTDCGGSCGWLRPAGPRRGCRTPCARPTAGSPTLRRGAVRFQPPGYLPASSRSVIEPDHAARTMSTRRDGARRHSGPSTGVRPVARLSAWPLASESASLPAFQPARVPQASPENPYRDRRHRFLSAAGSARSTAPACAWPHRGTHGQFVALLFPADCRCRPPDHRSRSRQQRRRAHRRVGAPSATWALSALSRGAHTPFRHRRCGSLRHRGLPGLLSTGHLRTLRPERRYRSALPSRTSSD